MAAVASLALAGCGPKGPSPEQTADTIYSGGDIITVNDQQPTAEAVAVHTFYFGEAHLKQRGKEQTYFISPMRTAIDKGLRPTNHTDFNVAPIDQMFVLWSAVNRISRAGEVIGPDERVSPLDALKAITINAAYQYFEEKQKGSIEPGKLADLVILSANPLKVAPGTIKDIVVLETIKEGMTVYKKN